MFNLSLLHLKIASETPNHQLLARYPRTRGQGHDVSVYKTCAYVIHTNLHVHLIVLSFHIKRGPGAEAIIIRSRPKIGGQES